VKKWDQGWSTGGCQRPSGATGRHIAIQQPDLGIARRLGLHVALLGAGAELGSTCGTNALGQTAVAGVEPSPISGRPGHGNASWGFLRALGRGSHHRASAEERDERAASVQALKTKRVPV
jgi:hypothetical protein